jgi:hypothetical protein
LWELAQTLLLTMLTTRPVWRWSLLEALAVRSRPLSREGAQTTQPQLAAARTEPRTRRLMMTLMTTLRMIWRRWA